MRFRAVVGSLLGGLALAVAVAAPVLAEEPPDLGASPILDLAGVLDDPAAADAAIDDAFDRTGVSLFVVLVDSFDSPADADHQPKSDSLELRLHLRRHDGRRVVANASRR